MSIFHNSTRVNRLPEVRDKATAGLRSNRFKASIIKKWLCVVLCLVFVFSALGVAVPQAVRADEEGYLFDRVITWADGTQEHVQIDSEGYFWLDGVKKKLVGFHFGSGSDLSVWNSSAPWSVAKHWWWTPTNLTFLESVLSYLQGKGVRLLRLPFHYTYQASTVDEAAAYRALLDLMLEHKMLIVGIVTPKLAFYQEGFNCVPPTSGFVIPDCGGGWGLPGIDDDTLGSWLTRLAPIIAEYPNVVSMCCDNELDNHMGAQDYSVADAVTHFTYLKELFKTYIPGIVITHNFCSVMDPITDVLMPLVDFPSFDIYQATADGVTTVIESWKSHLGVTNFWINEIGQLVSGAVDNSAFPATFINNAFTGGASTAIMFLASFGEAPIQAFFANDGSPLANTATLLTDNMATWQAGIAFTITASAGANGSMSPTGNVVINQGGNQSFTIIPATGYHVADVLVDGASVGAVTSYTFSNVTDNHTISASFTADTVTTFTITASAGANGSISPTGNVVINQGGNQTFTITPATGYHVIDVLVDGASVGAVASYNFSNVTANHTINASFAADTVTTFTITASAGANGSISPTSAVAVNYGADQVFAIAANTGYHVADVLVDGASVGAVASYTFSNVTANHTISASFATDTVTTFTITASAGADGSISPTSAVAVNYGADQVFAIAANTGYHVADVLMDGASVGAVTSCTFSNVTANHTISASFTQNQYTLTVGVTGSGSVPKVPNQATYPSGTPVQLTATADPGSSFNGWSGDLTGSANPATIAVDGNKTVTATFATNLTPTSGGPQKLIGADDAAGLNESGNYILLTKFQAVATGQITEFRVKSGATAQVKVAIYDDNSGEPGGRLSYNNTAQNVVAGWNTLSIPALNVTSGTYYWLGLIGNSTGAVQYISGSSSNFRYKAATFAGFTWTDPAGSSYLSTGEIELVAGWGIPGPAPLSITTTSLPDATVGVSYSQTVQASGGSGSYSWSITAGSLPAGLGPINSSTGVISGTPTTAGTSNFTVQVNDGSTTATKNLSIIVSPLLQKLIGANDAATTGNEDPNYFLLDKFTAEATGDVSQIRLKCGSSGNVRVAIYADSSGEPGDLLPNAFSASTPVVAGWNQISITSTPVTAGTAYWLACISDSRCMYYVYPGGTGRYKSASYSGFSFPGSAGPGLASWAGYHLIAGWGAPPPPPDTAPALTPPGAFITFKLGTAERATTYWLQVNTQSDFNGTNLFNAEVGNVTTQEVTGLSLGTTYYWRVKAGNVSGWGPWSSVRSVLANTVL